jgi:hypothetical protein
MKEFVVFFNTGNDDAECFGLKMSALNIDALLNTICLSNNIAGAGNCGLSNDTYAFQFKDEEHKLILFPDDAHEFIRKHNADGWVGARELTE